MTSDMPFLYSRLEQLADRQKNNLPFDRVLATLEKRIRTSSERRKNRLENMPNASWPVMLPVVERRDEILSAIRDNQVVIVCGETGSGKTTQLPKMLLECGLGISGMIGHTQPRRIAARSVASRIATELGCENDRRVAYKVRFGDRTDHNTLIKLMTDGVLLAEMQHDRDLNAYSALIIDEAHERSLNIDFLLGYIKRLVDKRSDLKVIITSATIDSDSFSRHFSNAPVINVSGRTYPVEIRYRPLTADTGDDEKPDQTEGVLSAVDELQAEGPGDILVFFSSEREIRDTAEALSKHHPDRYKVLPLYSRLSAAEQQKVFSGCNKRRIVLATNVAETSLTVPGIHYVIDSGKVRMSRYSTRSKVQRLPVEAVSQASANQRAGRCGRIAPGICIRLYSEEDYLSRETFTRPEILRSNLSNVILQMEMLALGSPESFPFIDPPDNRAINDGYRLLEELSAIDHERRLTRAGRTMAYLPVDVRLAAMVVAAQKENCLREIMIIVAGLSVQDPRERPQGKAPQADECHERYQDPRSDFLFYVNLWHHFDELYHSISKNRLRKFCRQNYLSWTRMLEWRDLYSQLYTSVKEKGMKVNQVQGEYHEIHRAVLTGLISNIALKNENHVYQGARNTTVSVFPGSVLFGKPPKWIMAFEIIETTKNYARTAAGIDPSWVESMAGNFIRKSWSSPHWSKKRGQVVAYERSMLYGLVIRAKRVVNYSPVNREEARRIFISEALVPSDIDVESEAIRDNARMTEEIGRLQDKMRRTDILVDDDTLASFYDAVIPEDVSDLASLKKWLKRQQGRAESVLRLNEDQLVTDRHFLEQEKLYPEVLDIMGNHYPLQYHFMPGDENDGITMQVPAPLLQGLDETTPSWLVQGYVRDKVMFLLKSLPKDIRIKCMPLAETADAFVSREKNCRVSLEQALLEFVSQQTGMSIDRHVLENVLLPDYLRVKFQVIDERKHVIARDDELARLKNTLAREPSFAGAFMSVPEYEQTDITADNFPDIPESLEVIEDRLRITVYPGLLDEGDMVSLKCFAEKEEARAQTYYGILRLFFINNHDLYKYALKSIPPALQLRYSPLGDGREMVEQLINKAAEQVLFDETVGIRNRSMYEKAEARSRGHFLSAVNELSESLSRTLDHWLRVHAILEDYPDNETHDDVHAQIESLVYPGFIEATPLFWLQQLPRYVKGMELRLERARQNPDADIRRLHELQSLIYKYNDQITDNCDEKLIEFGWQLEELRLSLFAQQLKTLEPVSVVRLERILDALAKV